MKVMVVGGGGREHAIIKKIKMNKKVTEIFALPGNGGMANDATCVDIGAKDITAIVDFAVSNKIDYAIVAPDDPLVLGAVDALEEKGIPCFGPRANAAIIFYYLRSLRSKHKSEIEASLKRSAFCVHSLYRRNKYVFHALCCNIVGIIRIRSNSSHSSCIKTCIVISDSLMIHRRYHRNYSFSVCECKNRNLRSGQKFFYYNSLSAFTKRLILHH